MNVTFLDTFKLHLIFITYLHLEQFNFNGMTDLENRRLQ